MSELCKFQIVIPTVKGREKYLYDAISSVLKQEYSEVEVIVSNNGADPGVKKCVESFNSNRIVYAETSSQLAMAEHWEFAISHVNADFFTIIGDDDALTSSCIKYVLQALNLFPNALCITHRPAQYFWPDYIVKEHQNLYIMHGGNTGKIKEIQTKEIFKKVCEFREHYGNLPFLYHGFVSTKLVRKIQKIESRIFARIAPDVYSDLLLAHYLESFVSIDAPLTIGGQGAKSNGANVSKETKEGKVFFNNLPEFLEPKRPAASIYLQLFEYIEKIKKQDFSTAISNINWRIFVFRCVLEAARYKSNSEIILQGVKDVLELYCPPRKRFFFLGAIKLLNTKLSFWTLRYLLGKNEVRNFKKWGNAVNDFSTHSVLGVAWAINKRNRN
jgi:glycosyltransferase involved in cell wall biosynthesis